MEAKRWMRKKKCLVRHSAFSFRQVLDCDRGQGLLDDDGGLRWRWSKRAFRGQRWFWGVIKSTYRIKQHYESHICAINWNIVEQQLLQGTLGARFVFLHIIDIMTKRNIRIYLLWVQINGMGVPLPIFIRCLCLFFIYYEEHMLTINHYETR